MGASFAQEIASLKQEVTNLKIAHKRGVGLVRFYQRVHAARLTIGRQWKVTLTAKDDAIVPFISHLYFSFDFGYSFAVLEPVKVSADGRSIIYTMNYSDYNFVYIKVVATSDMDITTEVL